MRKNPLATQTPLRQLLPSTIHVDPSPQQRQTAHLHRHPRRPTAIPRHSTLRRRHNTTRKRRQTPRHDNRRHAGTAPHRHGTNHRLQRMHHHPAMATMATILLQTLKNITTTSYTSKAYATDNPALGSHKNSPPSKASNPQSRNHEKPPAHPSSAHSPTSA